MSEGPPVLSSVRQALQPQSVALVGASERSVWSNAAYGNFRRFEFPGKVHLITRKGDHVYGQASATSCAAVGETIDAALLMIPSLAIPAALEDLGAAGGKSAVILSSGYSEAGGDGAARQAELLETANRFGIRLIGPNCLGFVNFVDRVPLWTNPMRRPMKHPSLALISQSGAVVRQMADFAYYQRIGLTYMVSTGNEANLDLAAVLEFVIDDPATKSVGMFIETVRDTAAFARAAERALDAGKPLVALKVGRSEATAAAAQAHTGSLVGDDRVFDAVCRRYGIIRVKSAEDLVVTADLVGRLGPLERSGVGFICMSGGMCEIASDRVEEEGIMVPDLQPATVKALGEVLPEFGTPRNPLDITGAAMLSPDLFEEALGILGKDPLIGLITTVFDAPINAEGDDFSPKVMTAIGKGFAASGTATLAASHLMTQVTADSERLAREAKLLYSGAGLHHVLTAIGGAMRWNEARKRPERKCHTTVLNGARPLPVGERATLNYLAEHGVGIIPAELVNDGAAAAAAAHKMGGPVVLKIASADIAHKTDVGGVALNVAGNDVAAAFDAMIARIRQAVPHAKIDGVIVSPMRQGGIELLVGVTRDPQWGLSIALGLGGVLVEVLRDVQIRLLPVQADDVLEMIDGLKGRRLLDGYRGAPAVDRHAIAEAVVRIGNAALALGPKLAALEVNPLFANGARVEALDGLVISADAVGKDR